MDLDTDSDPAFFLIADPVRIPDLDPGFDDLKLEKMYKIFIFIS